MTSKILKLKTHTLLKSPRQYLGRGISHVGASLVAQMVKNLPATQETWVQSLGWEDKLEEGMATYPNTPEESPWKEEPGELQFRVAKSQDTTEQLSLHFTSTKLFLT